MNYTCDSKYFENKPYISNKDNNIKTIYNEYDYVKIVWVNNKLCPNDFTDNQYYNHFNEIRRKYPRQTYIYFPFNFSSFNKILLCKESADRVIDNIIDGYIIISKRDYRSKFSKLRYIKINLLKDKIEEDVNKFVNVMNDALYVLK